MSLGLKGNTIELVEHDPQWGKIAAQTIQTLQNILGSLAKDIQHIGSTSLHHIKAKPIIDIAAAINDFVYFEPLIPELEGNGFSYRGWFIDKKVVVLNIYEDSASEDRLLTHHIHIVKADGKEWHDYIDFRDYMNAHPSAAKEYEALKIKLASEYPYDEGRKRYSAGKSEFISGILQNARTLP